MIWALADLHLSRGVKNKTMDVFGPAWQDHMARIKQHWLEQVAPTDTVILPGDLSWGMNLDEAKADLIWIHQLPGQKYLSRGNHDYWWTTLSKLEGFAQAEGLDSLHFMRMGAYPVETPSQRAWIVGTRGWILPGDRQFTAEDRRIYERELARLKRSLDTLSQQVAAEDAVICALHYPPLMRGRLKTAVTELLAEYGITLCLYGHLHGRGLKEAITGEVQGITYLNVAADALEMKPVPVPLMRLNPTACNQLMKPLDAQDNPSNR